MSTEDYSFSEIDGGYRIGTLDPSTLCTKGVPAGYKAYETNKTPVSPSKYNGKDILEVGRCAYAYTDITKVTILEPIQTIQCWAFEVCKSLKEVYLPATLLSIAKYAFKECTSLSLLIFCRNETVSCGAGIFYNGPSTLVIKVPKTSSISSLLSYSTEKTLNSSCVFIGNPSKQKSRITRMLKMKMFNIVPSLIYNLFVKT